MYALARHHLSDKHMEQRHDDEENPNPLQHLCGVQIGHDPIACDRQVKEAPNRYHAQACDQDRTSLHQPGAQNIGGLCDRWQKLLQGQDLIETLRSNCIQEGQPGSPVSGGLFPDLIKPLRERIDFWPRPTRSRLLRRTLLAPSRTSPMSPSPIMAGL